MSLSVGICGLGAFAPHFIPLIQAHPRVGRVVLCDSNADRLQAACDRFGIADTCPSLDRLCESDVDAIALFTQNDRHAPQAIQAIRAGKHVYSAVPSAISVEEITDLVHAVEAAGRIYMIGETSYYYPCAMYCRQRFRAGDFGYAVFGEGEYMHDFDHGMEQVYRGRFGDDWQRHASIPPFFYPTHSVSMIVSVTGARAMRVSGVGVRHQYKPGETDFTKTPSRLYDNDFENEFMLCTMSDGSAARFSEYRRVGYWHRPGGVGMSLYGSEGSFEQQIAPPTAEAYAHHRCVFTGKQGPSVQDVTDQLTCLRPSRKGEAAAAGGLGDEVFSEQAPVHPMHLLPDAYRGLGNGHEGSHQFLMHEFITAAADRVHSVNNVWQAARYLLPGLIAHESARQGGAAIDVPDFGDCPHEVWDMLADA